MRKIFIERQYIEGFTQSYFYILLLPPLDKANISQNSLHDWLKFVMQQMNDVSFTISTNKMT